MERQGQRGLNFGSVGESKKGPQPLRALVFAVLFPGLEHSRFFLS